MTTANKATRAKEYVTDVLRGILGTYELQSQIHALGRSVDGRLEALSRKLAEATAARRASLQSSAADAASSEGFMRGRIDEVQGLLVALQADLQTIRRDITEVSTRENATKRRQKIRATLSGNGLFVVGHARSGTSILQIALNTSPDIFLLGEANLHMSHQRVGFAAWYRAMHHAMHNPPTKSTSCPDPDDPNGDAWDVLMTARQQYRLIGDKMAFRSRRLGYDFDGAFRFLQDYFPGAHIIGTLRNPRDVLSSNAQMFSPDDLKEYVVSYLECLAFEVDLICTFDRATILVHEKITPDTFIDLGHWLDIDLRTAYARCYEPDFLGPRHPVPEGLSSGLLELADTYYCRLQKQFELTPCGHPSMMELSRIRHDLRVDLRRLETE